VIEEADDPASWVELAAEERVNPERLLIDLKSQGNHVA